MKHIKIALGDLRHHVIGRHSVFMPLGIGQLASYTLSQIGSENATIKFYTDPEVIIKDIGVFKPDVVGLSNYCWNSELSRLVFQHAKTINPLVICIAGGPEFPMKESECRKYLLARKEIDFYIYFEGELGFCELIKKIMNGKEVNYLKRHPIDGIMSLYLAKNKLVFGKPLPRPNNLDILPSPYLMGLMNQWFDGCSAPSIQTNRGCPFSCAYCFAGDKWCAPVTFFSVQRIKDELTYIAQKMKDYPNILLSICDSNFGIYKRDEEIARHCKKLQDRYGWPNAFNVTTGKANYGRVLKVAAILKNKMNITCSLQSLNPKTLKAIKRKNPSMDEFHRIQEELKGRGMKSGTELITPLPEETEASYFEGMKTVVTAGIEHVVIYTTMLLRGTRLASKEYRKKYKMQTKFRILPRQFGKYLGKNCFEIEEVCVATNSLSYDEYLRIRGAALIYVFFSTKQFDVIHRHLKDLGINRYEYFNNLWNAIRSDKTSLSVVYNRYINETKKELWQSEEAIHNYFQKPKNFYKLLKSDLGDNLIRKYNTELLLKAYIPAVKLAYSVIKDMVGSLDKEVLESLDSANRWMLAIRNISNIFKYPFRLSRINMLHADYDILEWYRGNERPLISFHKPVKYRIFYDRSNLNVILRQGKVLYGNDIFFMVGKMLQNWSVENFWCQCECLKKTGKASRRSC